jgi:hypothetical protein
VGPEPATCLFLLFLPCHAAVLCSHSNCPHHAHSVYGRYGRGQCFLEGRFWRWTEWRNRLSLWSTMGKMKECCEMLLFGSRIPQRLKCQRLCPTVVLFRGVEPLRGGASWKVLGHWGCALQGHCRTLVSSLSFTKHEGRSFVPPQAIMCFILTRCLKARCLPDHRLEQNLQICEAK